MKTPAPDLRVEKTIKKLEQALFHLLQESSVDRISVSKLCAEAGISRSTFYFYFHSVSELLDYLVEHCIRDFETAANELRTDRDYLKFYTELLTYIKKRQTMFYCLFVTDHQAKFFERTALLANTYRRSRQIEPTFAELFSKNGADGIIKEWLIRGCQQPVSDIAGLLAKYVKCCIDMGNT